jgi:metallo-beta-lactamase family protein
MLSITPFGAAGGEVTGSCYLLQHNNTRLLIDCGLFQGGSRADELNRDLAWIRHGLPDAILITHAHLDHVGRLPLLAQTDFKGPIWATPATIQLAELILRDAAKVQSSDTERQNKRNRRRGHPDEKPLYTPEDVEAVLALFKPVPYRQPVNVAAGIDVIWSEAGHMLGSASLQVNIQEDAVTRRIVFSGDLGPVHAPILKEFEPFSQADAVFLESTYGDRDHRPLAETIDEFRAIIRAAAADKGHILIPTFAVGRAQMLTLLLASMFRNREVPAFPVFLDSPMAIEAARILSRHPELFDAELRAFLSEGNLDEDLRTLKTTATAEQSRGINEIDGPCLVMAGAGMCNAGRILHHLKHHLWKPSTNVIIVGFQSNGSLGRRLVDGEKEVRILGEAVCVKAKIHTLGGFSAHAGRSDLLKWLEMAAGSRPSVFLTHGEEKAREALCAAIHERTGLAAQRPALGSPITL